MTALAESGTATGLPSLFDPARVSAIVLAAGRGVRLRPATDDRPKALLTVHGETLLDYHLRLLREAGIRRAVVVIGYRSDQVRTHLDSRPPDDLEVECLTQDPPRGTGDAVRRAFERVDSNPFLVAYSDVYWGPRPTIYRELLENPEAKIVAAEVADGSAFGRLEVHRVGRSQWLSAIREKDGRAVPGLVNAGLYLLPRSVGSALGRLSESPRGEVELTDAVAALAALNPVRVLVAQSWTDIGTPERWAAAGGPGP